MKEAELAARQYTIAEDVKQGSFHVSTQEMWQNTHSHLDIQRDVDCRLHHQIVPNTPVGIQVALDFVQQSVVRLFFPQRINHNEYLVPSTGPPQCGGSALHLGIALSKAGIVISSDSTLQISTESTRRKQFDLVQRFRQRPAKGWKWIAGMQLHFI